MEKRKAGSGKMIVINAARGKQALVTITHSGFSYCYLKGEHTEGHTVSLGTSSGSG